ncbi:M24 family metallopeptidase [Desulfovibrio litoralis]|uniref:Xaa-Pro dipeptidase n=1 Tax=Desulfovibrio litoralis DSM 11393 TaxID=1121455 RepID=A0A1M7S9F9_9BACT|nr:M24 family metallopeptidase [Desulfovibrio litoralis]SHN54932.1 Xaa-Pro dipeptidase [Desulfovibrio litoralis DSM 11393]
MNKEKQNCEFKPELFDIDYQKTYSHDQDFTREEMELRLGRLRSLLNRYLPEASGVLIFSRIHIYYFTGTFANGCLWIPLEGEPILTSRKGIDRAKLESPLTKFGTYKSFKELPNIFKNFEVPFGNTIAVEKAWLPWNLSESLISALNGIKILAADRIIELCRSVKTEWELKKMRLSGERMYQAQVVEMPNIIKIGMSELEIAHKSWEIVFQLGHGGTIRMKAPEENMMLGIVSRGMNANYPTFYNGPIGHQGEHPALPYMGSKNAKIQKGDLINADFGFCYEAYLTDRTQVYFMGKKSELPKPVLQAQELCQKIEDTCSTLLKAGELPSIIYEKALELVEKTPFKQGFMGLSSSQVPFIGHGIGLQVDEYPAIAKRFDEPLENAMTIALEPKIGLSGYGMVGVEDTYEITKQGAISLTGKRKPMDIICLE